MWWAQIIATLPRVANPIDTPQPGAPMLRPDLLPESAQLIAAEIGLEGLWALVTWLPGIRLQVPGTMTPGHPIARKLGFEAAKRLTAIWGSSHLDVPQCRAAIRGALHDEIKARRRAGETENELALSTGLTARTIRRICSQD